MTEFLFTKDALSKEEKYEFLLKQIPSLISDEYNLISNLANLSAAIKQSFESFSWVGFYLFDGRKLYVGPFQGKVACTIIDIGKGVCGKAAEVKETIIVPDVSKFSGHIYCDPDSKSEIVIPLINANDLHGVLDIDSCVLNNFDEVDKKYLELICKFLCENIF